MGAERRRHVRKRVDLAATVEVGGEQTAVHVSDMSPGGALLDVEARLAIGTAVKLHITFPGDERLTVNATVRWAKPDGVGIQFGVLGARQTFVITEHLATLE